MCTEHILADSKIDVAQFSLPSDVFHLNNHKNDPLKPVTAVVKPEGSRGLANSSGRKLLSPNPGLVGPEGQAHPQDWLRKISFYSSLQFYTNIPLYGELEGLPLCLIHLRRHDCTCKTRLRTGPAFSPLGFMMVKTNSSTGKGTGTWGS